MGQAFAHSFPSMDTDSRWIFLSLTRKRLRRQIQPYIQLGKEAADKTKWRHLNFCDTNGSLCFTPLSYIRTHSALFLSEALVSEDMNAERQNRPVRYESKICVYVLLFRHNRISSIPFYLPLHQRRGKCTDRNTHITI